MDPRYGERYRQLFERHWWWRSRTEFIIGKVRQLQPSRGWRDILDVGCGDGLFFDKLSEFGNVDGVEPSQALVNPNGRFFPHIHVGPFDHTFRPEKQYSLILMLDVLEHIEDALAALRRVIELLLPGGTFIATVPAFMALWTNHDNLNHHFTRYVKSSLRALMLQAGFEIREERYLYYWTCPVKLGVRVVERTLRLEPMPASVPPSPVNEVLYLLSRLEQKTLSRLPMPFGSSLLVVGQKACNQTLR